MIKKKHLFFSISVLFFSILFVDLLASSLYSFYKDKNTENDILRAGEVENIISRKLREALLVCRYMASDSLLIDVIHKEPSRSLDETLVVLRPYLSKIKDKYSYSTVDFLSDQTHRYYNEFGVLKTIDPDNWDFWYKRFTNEEIYFDIETFRDPDDYSKSQIFFNVRVDEK